MVPTTQVVSDADLFLDFSILGVPVPKMNVVTGRMSSRSDCRDGIEKSVAEVDVEHRPVLDDRKLASGR